MFAVVWGVVIYDRRAHQNLAGGGGRASQGTSGVADPACAAIDRVFEVVFAVAAAAAVIHTAAGGIDVRQRKLDLRAGHYIHFKHRIFGGFVDRRRAHDDRHDTERAGSGGGVPGGVGHGRFQRVILNGQRVAGRDLQRPVFVDANQVAVAFGIGMTVDLDSEFFAVEHVGCAGDKRGGVVGGE